MVLVGHLDLQRARAEQGRDGHGVVDVAGCTVSVGRLRQVAVVVVGVLVQDADLAVRGEAASSEIEFTDN